MKNNLNKTTRFFLRSIFIFLLTCSLSTFITSANPGKDTLAIHHVGHGSVYFELNGFVVHVDPYSAQGNYASFPDADVILVTHHHGDHLDDDAINQIKKESTVMVYNQKSKDAGVYSGEEIVLANWESTTVKGLPIKAVPAYNYDGTPNHPKGDGNGYIITFNDLKVYLAGDTEDIPEMDTLGHIDIAFLPMNLPYTMTDDQLISAAHKLNPEILYVYHFAHTDETDTTVVRDSLSGTDIDLRIDVPLRYEYAGESESPLGIIHPAKNNNSETLTTLYPNPVSNALNISLPETLDNHETELSIVNSSGSLVYRYILNHNQNSFTVRLNNHGQGIYYLSVKNKKGFKETIPFVKIL